ncbi:wnt inhibitory factor 1-like isoform X2 [Antedon mediterranea]|uniref:wnt inhibitory factor 1-like isoform X2 n=1 Tax=Antedon mediterranea TaxID=105859 RepID=UPI003AF7772B
MLASAVALLVIYSLLLCPSGALDNDTLELWIEGKEMRKISGSTTDFQLVNQGRYKGLLTSESQLTLPEHQNSLRFKWQAPPGYKYSIDQLVTSGDSGLSTSPYLSIPHAGDVPHVESEFQLWLPCEDGDGEMKSVYISLSFTNSDVRRQSRPVTININKRCNIGTVIPCRHACENGGSCGKYGVCECPDGYYGPACRQVLCVPHCFNGGTCTKPGVCSCVEGYHGKICEKASCKNDCNNNGRCIGPDKCMCYKQWTGKYCKKQLTSEVYEKFYKMTRVKRKSPKSTKIRTADNRKINKL